MGGVGMPVDWSAKILITPTTESRSRDPRRVVHLPHAPSTVAHAAPVAAPPPPLGRDARLA